MLCPTLASRGPLGFFRDKRASRPLQSNLNGFSGSLSSQLWATEAIMLAKEIFGKEICCEAGNSALSIAPATARSGADAKKNILQPHRRSLVLSRQAVVRLPGLWTANLFFWTTGAINLSTKRCNNHRRIVAYGVLNCADSPTDHAMVDPGSYRFWVRNDSVLTTTCGSLLRSTTQFVRELPEAMSKHQG